MDLGNDRLPKPTEDWWGSYLVGGRLKGRDP